MPPLLTVTSAPLRHNHLHHSHILPQRLVPTQPSWRSPHYLTRICVSTCVAGTILACPDKRTVLSGTRQTVVYSTMPLMYLHLPLHCMPCSGVLHSHHAPPVRQCNCCEPLHHHIHTNQALDNRYQYINSSINGFAPLCLTPLNRTAAAGSCFLHQ